MYFKSYTYNDCKNGSLTNVFKYMQYENLSISEAIIKQAAKFPKSLRQYWADTLLLAVYQFIKKHNKIKRFKHKKERKTSVNIVFMKIKEK